MGTQMQYASTPRCGSAVIATANTARSGTGTLGTVFTAGSAGSRIEWVQIKAQATMAAGTVTLFAFDGTNYYLLSEIQVIATTASSTVPSFEAAYVPPGPLLLPNGWSLRAGTTIAQSIAVTAFGGDL